MNHPHHQRPSGIGELMDETMMEIQRQEEKRITEQRATNRFEDTRPADWRDLPDDQTTACGTPLGQVWPELYDENNQPRPTDRITGMTSDYMRLNEPHPEIMWGAMFKARFTNGEGPEWVQQGPLFPTMNEAAAWGQENKGDYHFETPHLQPYQVTPTEVTATFKDPNTTEAQEDS